MSLDLKNLSEELFAHLVEEQVEALATGQAPSNQDYAEAHLRHCAQCQELVEEKRRSHGSS